MPKLERRTKHEYLIFLGPADVPSPQNCLQASNLANSSQNIQYKSYCGGSSVSVPQRSDTVSFSSYIEEHTHTNKCRWTCVSRHTCCLRSNSPSLQLCSFSRGTFFFFYIFTLSDKAPVAFSIMLCRCSQQERVIALGVWSSLRRIGSSGQSCQGLPKDSPGCACTSVCDS